MDTFADSPDYTTDRRFGLVCRVVVEYESGVLCLFMAGADLLNKVTIEHTKGHFGIPETHKHAHGHTRGSNE